MIGTISKIHELKSGSGGSYRRVEFNLSDGRWAKTDLCPAFRNFKRWKQHLTPGTRLANLVVNGTTVDADSFPCAMTEEGTER